MRYNKYTIVIYPIIGESVKFISTMRNAKRHLIRHNSKYSNVGCCCEVFNSNGEKLLSRCLYDYENDNYFYDEV